MRGKQKLIFLKRGYQSIQHTSDNEHIFSHCSPHPFLIHVFPWSLPMDLHGPFSSLLMGDVDGRERAGLWFLTAQSHPFPRFWVVCCHVPSWQGNSVFLWLCWGSDFGGGWDQTEPLGSRWVGFWLPGPWQVPSGCPGQAREVVPTLSSVWGKSWLSGWVPVRLGACQAGRWPDRGRCRVCWGGMASCSQGARWVCQEAVSRQPLSDPASSSPTIPSLYLPVLRLPTRLMQGRGAEQSLDRPCAQYWVTPHWRKKGSLCYSAWAAITKYHRLGSLKNRRLFLTVLEARNPRSRCWLIWFLVRALFLACRWAPSRYVLTWQRESERDIHIHTQRERERERERGREREREISINPTMRLHPHDLV